MVLDKSKENTISADAVSQSFDDLMRRAHDEGEHFIVERDGEAVVVIMPAAEFESWKQMLEEREREERVKRGAQLAREIGEEIEASGLTEEDLMAMSKEIRAEIFKKHYGDFE